jgi:hypothetical protein
MVGKSTSSRCRSDRRSKPSDHCSPSGRAGCHIGEWFQYGSSLQGLDASHYRRRPIGFATKQDCRIKTRKSRPKRANAPPRNAWIAPSLLIAPHHHSYPLSALLPFSTKSPPQHRALWPPLNPSPSPFWLCKRERGTAGGVRVLHRCTTLSLTKPTKSTPRELTLSLG